MSSPRPYAPVRGSRTGRPIMALLDLLGRRMSLRILWELHHAPLTFRALQAAAGTNPGVLNTRLKELREVRLVSLEANGYALTRHGRELIEICGPMNGWAERWAQSTSGKDSGSAVGR